MNDIFYWLEGLDDLSYNKVRDYITNLQQENERLKEWKEDLLKEKYRIRKYKKEAIDKLTIKQARFINEKDYVLDDNDLDEIMLILQKMEVKKNN